MPAAYYMKRRFVLFIVLLCSCRNMGPETKVFFSSTKNGITKETIRNYVLLASEQYKKDSCTKNGLSVFYNADGGMSKKLNYQEGKLCGGHIEYYKNGAPRFYICHDSCGDTMLYRQYDSLGNIVAEKGDFGVPYYVDDTQADSSRVLSVASWIVQPPHTSTVISSAFIYNNVDTIWPFKEIVNYDWKHIRYYNVASPGQYRYFENIVFEDSARKKAYVIKQLLDNKYYGSNHE